MYTDAQAPSCDASQRHLLVFSVQPPAILLVWLLLLLLSLLSLLSTKSLIVICVVLLDNFFRNSWFPWETDLFGHVVVVLSLADKLSGKNGEAPDQSLIISVYFFSIERNSGDEERPLAEESPLTNFLLSNQQAKTVLYKRVKRQWSQFEEDRNEYY